MDLFENEVLITWKVNFNPFRTSMRIPTTNVCRVRNDPFLRVYMMTDCAFLTVSFTISLFI